MTHDDTWLVVARRTMARAEREGMTAGPGDCWEWTGARMKSGYGRVGTNRNGNFLVHRLAWQLANQQEVPAGLEVDHLCRNRACFNPAHLEPVTHRENIRRSVRGIRPPATHCRIGHEFTPENTWTNPKTGHRQCRNCNARRQREMRAERKATV